LNPYNSVIILGPTASGKTALATHLALQSNGAILSFDSRQVYRQLDIGTGKDHEAYTIGGITVPHYLIDLCDVNESFHSYAFVQEFITAFNDSLALKHLPILCGGTGLYFDLVLKKSAYVSIPNNGSLRSRIELLGHHELIQLLGKYPEEYRSHADTSTHKRTLRAIEVAHFLSQAHPERIPYPDLKPVLFGIELNAEERRMRINMRLEQRLNLGLINEVQQLIKTGTSAGRLISLGLEYKFITEYLQGIYGKEEMIGLLQTAIHQYAKRQMTWFRKMEREGNVIHWIDGTLEKEQQLKIINTILERN
jgi:tRNA dimethylallyltransferase